MTTENKKKTGRFQPGQSGNPGGRPRLSPDVANVKLLLKTMTPVLLQNLFTIATTETNSNRDRIAASKVLLDKDLPNAVNVGETNDAALNRLAQLLGAPDAKEE